MRNIARYLSTETKPTPDQKIFLQRQVVDFIQSLTNPCQIYFFGSILEDRFDSSSDIDVIAIYKSDHEADLARREIYKSSRPELGHSLEILCVDEESFTEKSSVGGIYWIARHQGFCAL